MFATLPSPPDPFHTNIWWHPSSGPRSTSCGCAPAEELRIHGERSFVISRVQEVPCNRQGASQGHAGADTHDGAKRIAQNHARTPWPSSACRPESLTTSLRDPPRHIFDVRHFDETEPMRWRAAGGGLLRQRGNCHMPAPKKLRRRTRCKRCRHWPQLSFSAHSGRIVRHPWSAILGAYMRDSKRPTPDYNGCHCVPGQWYPNSAPTRSLPPSVKVASARVFGPRRTATAVSRHQRFFPRRCRPNPDRLRRSSQEARATSGLNHPNILVVHDIGKHNRIPSSYASCSRARRCGNGCTAATAGTKAIDYAIQIAHGLAAAHEQRDRPSRSQAREPLRDDAMATSDPRFRHRQADRAIRGGRLADADQAGRHRPRAGHRDRRLYVARAGAWPACRPALRYVQLWRRGLRNAFGTASVYGTSTVETMNAILANEPPEPPVAGTRRRCNVSGNTASTSVRSTGSNPRATSSSRSRGSRIHPARRRPSRVASDEGITRASPGRRLDSSCWQQRVSRTWRFDASRQTCVQSAGGPGA